MELFPFIFLWFCVLVTSTWRHKEIQVLQAIQSDVTWHIEALLLTRHKITSLQITLWKVGRGKTLKEIPSPQLLELWKCLGWVSCRAGFCYTVVAAVWVLQLCWPSESLCWCSLVLTDSCQGCCAPAAASQGIRAGGTKSSHSNLSPLLAVNTFVSLSKLEVAEET